MSGEEERMFALLDDLEQQAEGAFQEERTAEIADRGLREYAAVTLASRLMASVGSEVTLDVAGFSALTATLDGVADGWCRLARPEREEEWVVRLAALRSVSGCSERSVPEVAWPVTARLGLGSVLRRYASAGDRCLLHLDDGRVLEAVLGRVGADFVEVRSPDADVGSPTTPTAPTPPTASTLVAFDALVVVHRRG